MITMLDLLFVICAIVGAVTIVLAVVGVVLEVRHTMRKRRMMAEYIEASRRG